MNSTTNSTTPARTLHPGPDLFVAGAGPGGLAIAIAAAARGLSVQVADAMQPPIDKPCGEGLMPDSLHALAALGVDPAQAGHAPMHGIRFLTPTATAQADFPAEPGVGIRRNLLHQLLLDRAAALGVRFHWQTVVQSLEDGVVRTNRHAVRPRWIVGADGHQSRTRAAARLDRATTSSCRAGLQQHYALDLWTNHVEVHWGPHGQAYVTPVSATSVCVNFLARNKFPSLAAALADYPALQQRLRHAIPTGPTRGAVTLTRRLHRVTTGNLALLGDASGSVDAVTGEGLALCFRQATALAVALQAEDLSRYEAAHRRIRSLPGLMSHTMLLLDRSRFLRENAIAAFSRRPALFRRLLEIHLGDQPMRLLGAQGMLATGLHILAQPVLN